MKNIFTLLIIISVFKFSTAQTIDATLAELNFHNDSDPQNLISFQSGFCFTATDGNNASANFGRELWYSNGTPEGTLMIKDIRTGQSSSNPNSMAIIDETLFFTANDGAHGIELWKSDGTESGTLMIKDIRPNNNSENNAPYGLVAFNGEIYFSATNDIDGTELWKSDGTESGTFMVKDINPNDSSSPFDLFIFNNYLYFIANDGTGIELWKSDGTESGTEMVKNINSSYSGLNYGNQFLIMNNNFYFFADDGTNGSELWKSDGTESGTMIVKDIRRGPNSSFNSLRGRVLNNSIIFISDEGVNGTQIWKSDGTESGTLVVSNFDNPNFNNITSSDLIEFNNEVYFIADDNVHGSEIWKTDGTLDGTSLLKDINEGNSSISILKIHVDDINNKLLFYTTSTNSSEKTLWTSDGSLNGTFELSDVIGVYTENFITLSNTTIFSGKNGVNGNELWITDGTITGTSLFTDLNYSVGSNPTKFTDVNGDLFFRANGQLYKSNGSINGSQLVKHFIEGANSINDDSEMKDIDGTLFFSAIDSAAHGWELWMSDGTESGTIMVKDINPGSQSSMVDYQQFTVLNNILYFSADDGVNGNEIWRSDGTDSGTYMIKNINTSSNYSYGSHPRDFVLLNDIIYFIAHDNTGTALWTTDGTESGTIKIINLDSIRYLKVANNKLIIITYSPHDLWVSDGTASGTSHLQTFGDGVDSSIEFTATLNEELYFVAVVPTNVFRKAIYKTDGTITGTVLLYDSDTHPTIDTVDIDNILSCGNYVYFGVQDYFSNADEDLWRTNGIITEKIAGPDTNDFLYFRNLTCYNNNLLYTADSISHKIWITNDNLNEAFELNLDVINGPNFEGYNSIEELGSTSNNLYFRARNDISGSELYITNIDASTLSTTGYNIENNNIKLVNIYPNPANGLVNIKSINNLKITKFELWDLSGKKIHKQLNSDLKSEIKYDVSKLHTGIYFIKVTISDGKTTILKLIVN